MPQVPVPKTPAGGRLQFIDFPHAGTTIAQFKKHVFAERRPEKRTFLCGTVTQLAGGHTLCKTSEFALLVPRLLIFTLTRSYWVGP